MAHPSSLRPVLLCTLALLLAAGGSSLAVPSSSAAAVVPSTPFEAHPESDMLSRAPGSLRTPTLVSHPGGIADAAASRRDGRRGGVGSAAPSITYDVLVFAADSPSGASPATPDTTTAIIDHLDRAYAAATDGAYRFRFDSITRLPRFSGDTCDTNALRATYLETIDAKLATRAADAVPALWIIVTADNEACAFDGRATVGGQGIYMNGTWEPGPDATDRPNPPTDDQAAHTRWRTTSAVYVLGHEIGHNLNLRHANAYAYSGVTGSPLAGSPPSEEYGDPTDIMGSATDSDVLLSSYSRWRLGLLGTDDVTAAPQSATVTLGRLRSTSTAPKLLTIPTADSNTYLVDFRRGRERDWPLAYVTGERWASSGVFVRTLEPSEPWFYPQASLLPYTEQTLNNPDEGLHDYTVRRMSLRPGEQMNLPGGISIRVNSMSIDNADVTVTRPADTSATAPDPCELHVRTGTNTCTVVDHEFNGYPPGTYPFHPTLVQDDTWTSLFEMYVDGTRTHRVDLGSPDDDAVGVRRHLEYLNDFFGHGGFVAAPLSPGDHTVQFVVTDIAGNIAKRTAVVSVPSTNPPSVVLAPPRRLKVTPIDGRRMVVSFRPSTSTEANAYHLQVATGKSGKWVRAKLIRPRPTMRYRSARLKRGVRVTWRVRAQGAGESSPWVTSKPVRVR